MAIINYFLGLMIFMILSIYAKILLNISFSHNGNANSPFSGCVHGWIIP
jgi:hypothetical protein